MITETTREIEFPCVPWVVDNEASGIRPEKGTWTLVPIGLQALRTDVHGLLSCPNCAAIMLLSPLKSDEIDRKHQTGALIRKDVRCKCGLLFTARLLDWDKRRLYCVIYAVAPSVLGGEPKVLKEYLHAESREQAIWLFSQGHLDHQYKLIEAAPVFGYFVDEKNDKDAKTLMVD